MKKIITSLLTSLILFTQAFAHTKLESSTPENGSILENSPTEVLLSFNNAIRLTKITLSKVGGESVKLKLDKSKKFETNFSLSLEQVETNGGSGKYSIEWRGIGQDGHVMKGEFTYTVK